jgi:hypothetical protein
MPPPPTPPPRGAAEADRRDAAASSAPDWSCDSAVAALTALRDAGLATDRDALNRAWAELAGRAQSPGACQVCARPGWRFWEPTGVWCARCRPVLWRPSRAWWAHVPACHVCGGPGCWPQPRFGRRPVCRAHAGPALRRMLMRPDAGA